MKKIISLILALLTVISMVMPAVASDVGNPQLNNPLVYIRGAGKNLYRYENGVVSEEHAIYPVEIDTDAIVDALKPITEDLVKGMLTDDYKEYVDTVYNVFAPIFEEVVLDKNGEVKFPSGNGPQDYIDSRPNSYRVWDNNFGFDFRLSLLDTADELKAYIENTYKAAGNKKVAVLGRCLGTNLMAAYFTKYPDHARQYVSNIIMYVPATEGVDLISKLFSGKLEIQADNLDEFVDYFIENKNLIEDKTLADFISVLIEMLEYAKVLGLGMDAFQLLVDRLQGELIPKLGLASFLSFPSYWAMVNEEDFDDAKELVFAGQEEEYAGLIEKIDAYHYDVQVGFNDLLKQIDKEGIKVSVISKYNIPNIPISEASRQLGDFMASTKQNSYGATCADHGKVLSQSYIDSLADKKYVSPDKKVDASTCLFPDTTWFMKNSLHDDFPDDGNRLIKLLVDSQGKTSVFENEEWPQYVECIPVEGQEEGIFVPVEGTDSDADKPEEGSGEERFSIFIRFFTSILNFFQKLFRGEFDQLFKKD